MAQGDFATMRAMDEIYLKDPCIGTRRLPTVLEKDYGLNVNRKRLQRLRRIMGLQTIWCRPRTSIAHPAHKKHPYLLRGLEISHPNQVWCADITYIPMAHGSAYLCAVMDWHSRKVLGWAVSNTMDVSLCLRAFAMALKASGGVAPEIFNTDQGCQFTSQEWISALIGLNIKISMDGKGRWLDNVFIERLWRSLKYEDIYLREYRTVIELEEGLRRWLERYNTWRPHQHLENQTPAAVYQAGCLTQTPTKLAA
jgi:putative transposase